MEEEKKDKLLLVEEKKCRGERMKKARGSEWE